MEEQSVSSSALGFSSGMMMMGLGSMYVLCFVLSCFVYFVLINFIIINEAVSESMVSRWVTGWGVVT
jgi:hypothetical protein